MGLTKIEIEDFDLNGNKVVVVIDGEMKFIKLDKPTINAIKDNIASCIKEGTYIEL